MRISRIFFSVILLLFISSAVGFPQFNTLSQFERAKVSFKKGAHFFNKMQYLAAAEFFRKAVAEYPEYYSAREYLARSYSLAGFNDMALREWENLSNITSDNAVIQNKINTIRFRRVYSPESDVISEFILSEEIVSVKSRRFRFPKPVDLALDRDKNLYITSFSSGKVVKMNSNGEGVSVFNPGVNSRVYGIDIFEDRIAVSDYGEDLIRLLNLDLKSIKEFGSSGNGNGSFHGPEGLCFDENGSIFIVDSGNHRIQKFNEKGKFILKFGGYGEYEGQFNNPTDVAVYKDRVYVTDTGNKRLSCFDDSGNFIENITVEGMEFPRGIYCGGDFVTVSDERKGMLFYNVNNRKAEWPELWKEKEKRFSKLFSSVFDRDGFLYCLDYNYESVFVFSPLKSRYTSFDLEISSVDAAKYPVVAVYLNVRTQTGKPVYGLKRSNFTVIEDSARISRVYIDYLKDLDLSASIVMCVDRSLSNKGNHTDIPWVSEFILKKMRKNDSVKVLNFNSNIWTGNDFDWSRRRALKALRKKAYKKGKDISRALYNSIDDLLMKVNRRAVILVTDGTVSGNSFQRYSADNIINYAKSHFIPIHIIAFRGKDAVLTRIADETGGVFYRANEVDGLRGLYDRIRKQEEYRYVVVYYSFKMSSLKGWWSDLKIEANYKGQSGVEWGGYFVP